MTQAMTLATSLLEAKPKPCFYISCDQLTLSMTIIFFVHALHLGRALSNQKHQRQFKQDISIENNRQ
jgi:hypothetical protein